MTDISPDVVVDLLTKRLTLLVFVDAEGINHQLREMRLTLGAESTDDPEDQEWYLEDADGHRLDTSSTGQFLRVLYEGLSPSSFIEIFLDAFVRSKEIVARLESVPGKDNQKDS
jgi:hypothetical protein